MVAIPNHEDGYMKTALQDFDPLVPAAEARKEWGDISEPTQWRWEKAGIVPPARRINGRKYWLRSQVQAVKRA
jgi:hypothetical protein